MNSQFRSATRTLYLGLLAALSLAGIVTACGIHPEVLVAFKSLSDDVQLAAEPETLTAPLQFAQVEPATRLDAPASIRSVMGGNFKRTVVPQGRGRSAEQNPGEIAGKSPELPQLPPLPQAPGDHESDAFESPASEAEVVDAPAGEEMATPNDFEIATNSSTAPSTSSKADPEAESTPSDPMPGKPPVLTPAGAGDAKSESANSPRAESQELASRLDLLREQLEKLTAEQERQRLSHQSWLESAQLLQQQKLQAKFDEIEANLRDLKSKSAQSGKSEPYIQRLAPKDQVAASGPAPVVREERPGTDGEKRFSIESHQGGLRELLDTLTQKANLNLVLTINVEGDVEMSLQNATAEEALKAIQNTTGYIVEKAGKRVYVRPGPPLGHQREEYLPPIIKDVGPQPSAAPAL